jgi:hypothetical protein
LRGSRPAPRFANWSPANCFTIDARDIEGIGQCFTRDGSFRSLDGVMNATGRDAVIAQFHGRFAVLGPSNHFTHDHVIEFDELHSDHATGIVNTHAEVVRNDEPLLASLRYHDDYRFEDGRWRCHKRTLAFFYYERPADYREILSGASPQIIRYNDSGFSSRSRRVLKKGSTHRAIN